MRLLFIGPLPDPVTGQSLACRVLLDGIPDTIQVDVVNLSKKEFRQGISSLRRVKETLAILWHVWRKRKAADVIYLTVSESFAGNMKDVLIYLLCLRQLPRTVIHLHGGASMRRRILEKGSPLRAVNALFLRRLGGVIVLGQSHLETYSEIVARTRIHIVPNFAEDCLFIGSETLAKKFDRPYPLRVLFLSNLLPGKGHVELLEAFLELDERTKASLQIDFAGGFESRKDRTRFLLKVEEAPQLRYHGTVSGDRKRGLFQEAHLFCLPTYYAYEGQPISILEAYAAGCAVIATDHSGIRDVFSNGVNGFQVEKRSVADIRRAIETAVSDPARLHRIASTNLATALAKHRTAGYTTALVRILESVARTR